MKSSALFSPGVLVITLLTGLLFGLLPALPIITQPQSQSPAVQSATKPASVLRTASKIFVQAKSDFMDREALERELLKRSDFREWGMIITRNRVDADLLVEITRKKFTTRFTIRLIDPLTTHVLAADEASSLGGEIEPKLADRFVKLIKAARK